MVTTLRTRPDRCPGVLRPWPAADGGLVRVRLVGGRVAPAALAALGAVSAAYGDGDLHLTGRANLQLRGLPLTGPPDHAVLPAEVVDAVAATGLLPSPAHDLARNVIASPLTGLSGGRADLRPVLADLDRLLCAEPRLAGLPGRFGFVLDDGRGDLTDRPGDLGLVALSDGSAQLRIGSHGWGPVLALPQAAPALIGAALAFLDARGEGSAAAWHVDELPARARGGDLAGSPAPDPRALVSSPPPAYGAHAGHRHVEVPAGRLTPSLLAELRVGEQTLVVTPWHGVVVAGGAR